MTQWIDFLKQELETSQNEQIKLNVVTALGTFLLLLYFTYLLCFFLGAKYLGGFSPLVPSKREKIILVLLS